MKIYSEPEEKKINWLTLLWFFLPLGFSASLVTVSHVIINSTLARAPNPAFVIASYAIALSLFTIFERNAIMLRPTSAKLVQDQVSYKAVSRVTLYVLLIVMTLTLIIAYSFIGRWILTYVFGVSNSLLPATLDAYRILVFVTIFSIIRCFFQGIIIGNLRTKWMTIGMVIRLISMAGVAWFLINQGWVNHGYIGSIIFLIGMSVEALVSTWEGIYLLKKLPRKKEGHHVVHGSHVLRFYFPLLLASFMGVLIQPSIHATLAWSEKGAVAVASYAVAWSVTQLFLSFTTYIHQIVLNFYKKSPQVVFRFALGVNMIPAVCLASLVYTPIGSWFLQQVIGLTDELLQESLKAIQFFLLFSVVFPWLDFCHGLVMSRGETRIMAYTQAFNILITWIMLGIMVFFFSAMGGALGSLAQGVGFLAELTLLFFLLKNRAYHVIPNNKNTKVGTR